MRLGVLGGTFDPVHTGHLILAEEAREALRLAVAGNPSLDVSTLELERGGPTYTVETLAALRAELGEAVELLFILGEDALLDLPHWRDPAGILRLARLGVAARP